MRGERGEGLNGADSLTPPLYVFPHCVYSKMWADDEYWVPLFLRGERFEGTFEFAEDETTILKYELTTVTAGRE